MNKLYYVTLVIILTAKYMYRWKGIVLLCVCVYVCLFTKFVESYEHLQLKQLKLLSLYMYITMYMYACDPGY